MTIKKSGILAEIITGQKKDLLEDWLKEQLIATTLRRDLLPDAELRRQSEEFLNILVSAIKSGNLTNIDAPEWTPARDFLGNVSRSRAAQGFTPTETATFIFSIKQPVFTRLQQALDADAAALSAELWVVTVLLDKLGLYTTEIYQQSREAIIKRQQLEMLELSTPVVKIWEGILALPLIGTLDSARTQVVMESLLQSIVDTGSAIAIIDITGVPAVDTLVAQHLLKTVSAAKLMGAQCIISGIRPQIAQTMVHLGVAFGDVVTKASLSDALAFAFKQVGFAVTKQQARG